MAGKSALWAKFLTGPLYIPDEGQHVLSFLESSGPRGFVDELQRLSGQGSAWASAVLGYISLMPDHNAARDVEKTIAICSEPGERGDPYARFVLGWAFLFKGDQWRALKCMRAAMEAGFTPAIVDFARFEWNGVGLSTRNAEKALKTIRLAHRAGHYTALLWQCLFYRSGQLGLSRRLLGYALTPVASLRYLVAVWYDPFSSKVFTFQKDTPRLFKS